MKIKKVTQKLLKKHKACDGFDWIGRQNTTDPLELIRLLIKTGEKKKLQWANWGVVKLMTKKQRIRYAVYAAKQALHIFENVYAGDERPREAIRSAKKYLKHPTKKNKNDALSAANVAWEAANMAWQARYTAESARVWQARYTAESARVWQARYTAESARVCEVSAYDAASCAASAAACAASASCAEASAYNAASCASACLVGEACKSLMEKIIKHGIRILKEKKK